MANQCNFTTDRSFALFGAELLLKAEPTASGSVYTSVTTNPVDAGRRARFAFAAASETSSLSIDDAALQSFNAQQRVEQTPYLLSYQAGTRKLVVQCEEGLGTSHVALVRQQSDIGSGSPDQSYRLMFGGRDAQPGDRLVDRTYSALNHQSRARIASSESPFVDMFSTLNGMDYSSATGQARGALNLSTGFGAPVTIRFETTVAPGTTEFAGPVTVTDGAGNPIPEATGNVFGRFYGPEGEEVGYVITMAKGQERFVIVGIGEGR